MTRAGARCLPGSERRNRCDGYMKTAPRTCAASVLQPCRNTAENIACQTMASIDRRGQRAEVIITATIGGGRLRAWPSHAAVTAPRHQGRADPALCLSVLRRGDREVRGQSPMDRLGTARLNRRLCSQRGRPDEKDDIGWAADGLGVVGCNTRGARTAWRGTWPFTGSDRQDAGAGGRRHRASARATCAATSGAGCVPAVDGAPSASRAWSVNAARNGHSATS